MSVLVLACVFLLPALATAEVFFFGNCDWINNNDVDPIAFTQEGRNVLKDFASAGPARVSFWNPGSAEKSFTEMTLDLDFARIGFSLRYNTSDGSSNRINGSLVFSVIPETMIQLVSFNVNGSAVTFSNIFSFNSKGIADLYPLYISRTEVILKGCNPAFLGKYETLYVLTNQYNVKVDEACAIQTIKSRTGWTATVH